jgi:putative salt-induced outer membrane protein
MNQAEGSVMTAANHVLPAFIFLAAASQALADAPAPPPPENVWFGKGQFGFVDSSGNSQAEAINANLDMSIIEGPWKHEATLTGLYGKNSGITAAERLVAGWQGNYAISQDLFGFGGLRYEHDLFDGFQYQASGTLGLGYKLIDSAATKLSVQAGAGYRSLRPEELVKDAAGEVTQRIPGAGSRNAIVTAAASYSQALTQTTTISDKFLLESGSDDTMLHDEIALTVKMSTKLALSLGYAVNDNSKPAPGLKKLDTITTVNLVYAF